MQYEKLDLPGVIVHSATGSEAALIFCFLPMKSVPSLVKTAERGGWKAGGVPHRCVLPAVSRSLRSGPAFTLVELLVVMAVIVVMLGLSRPVVNALKNSGDVTSAAYDLRDALARARASAMANSTYVWVGLFEEAGTPDSTQPATAGVGRIVLSTVSSKDGTCLYDPSATAAPLDATRLGQTFKLVKLDHAHLTHFDDGTGTGGGFAGRPSVVKPSTNQISDQSATTAYTFTYPLGASGAKAQYTFNKVIQFSPRGETRINCVQDMAPVIEIGLMHSNGTAADVASKNYTALQMTGIASNLTLYRP